MYERYSGDCSKRSLSVLLSAVETSRRSYYSRVVFISLRVTDCASTIRGRWLFEGGVYSKKYGMYIHIHTATIGWLISHGCPV